MGKVCAYRNTLIGRYTNPKSERGLSVNKIIGAIYSPKKEGIIGTIYLPKKKGNNRNYILPRNQKGENNPGVFFFINLLTHFYSKGELYYDKHYQKKHITQS